MGNILSMTSSSERAAHNYELIASESDIMDGAGVFSDEAIIKDVEEENDENYSEERNRARNEEMDEFRKQLDIKREQRKSILARHRSEKEDLEKALGMEQKKNMEMIENNNLLRNLLRQNNIEIPEDLKISKENSDLRSTIDKIKEEFDILKRSNNALRRDLVEANNSLQNANSDIAELNVQNMESMKQIKALKEVITISKTMINLREQQLLKLKSKLDEIEQSLADRESNMLSANLRKEYERQLQNIRTLRGLYEERARLAEVTRQNLAHELAEQKLITEAETNRCKDLTARVLELEVKEKELLESIEEKNDQISSYREEARGLNAEMSAVNMLFAQVLLGYKTKQDLDKLVHRLEENHGLLTHMAENENGSEASSALPKLLLELVSQVDEKEESQYLYVESKEDKVSNESDTKSSSNTTPEEIVENLPKVWRVLTELLSHQSVPEANTEKVTTCYKSVDTKSGPVLVPSVSQTYIRLKDLIVEKLTLIKEVNRMKQLNTHLETRLEVQEKRLCLVTTELSKTWHVVGRLRRHHHQLHTHEKILRYELQQKRKLLNELKDELEYCREKWVQAREKNVQSEKDWKKLRVEFSSRKAKLNSPSTNNSAESGYSDERPSDESSESNDESEYVAESLVRGKKKLMKSFETIIDSSADFNLAAEREDPVSDMIDVADLPLDAQESESNEVSGSGNSKSCPINELICEETEDEVCDIVDDCNVECSIYSDASCSKNTSDDTVISCISEKASVNVLDTEDSNDTEDLPKGIIKNSSEIANFPTINASAILESIKQQNERLAKKDKKLESLEKCSSSLLKMVKSTSSMSDQINNTLDHLMNRPSCSKKIEMAIDTNDPELFSATEAQQQCPTKKLTSVEPEIDPNVILGVKDNSNTFNMCGVTPQNFDPLFGQENEVLMNKNENLEASQELQNFSNDRGKLTTELHEDAEVEHGTCQETFITQNDDSQSIQSGNAQNHYIENNQQIVSEIKSEEIFDTDAEDSEPSTSSQVNHEARFAARDLRLKRLEDQTKSLVRKVNKTATKGVKLHYKLQELHNIYGSENSRSGSPEDSEETPNDDGDETTEE